MNPTSTPHSVHPLSLCVHCGWTLGEFQSKRLLGCAHCYESLAEALHGELLALHPDLATSPWPPATFLGTDGSGTSPAEQLRQISENLAVLRAQRLAEWREQLSDALRREDYAEAARLKALIHTQTKPASQSKHLEPNPD
jgi:protein-arginine kinase activator protein McsA